MSFDIMSIVRLHLQLYSTAVGSWQSIYSALPDKQLAK